MTNIYSRIITLGMKVYLEGGTLKAKAIKGTINQEAVQLIKENKDALIIFLQQKEPDRQKQIITKVSRENNECRLSFAQQRLWFIDNLQGGSSEYNMPMAFEVAGQLETALLTDVFNTILARHEVLRTVYIEENGEALQHIRSMSELDFDIKLEDFSHLSGEVLSSSVEALVEADITTVFDLSADLMLRISYVKTQADTGVLLFNMHHIASDGWSMQVLTKEFFALYAAYSQGQINPLPELEIQYADYAHWQHNYLSGEVLESQLTYWEKQLDELPAVHSLPLDFSRPETKQFQGAIVTGELSAPTAKALLGIAKEHKLTPFMLLHGALSLLLSRHSNCNDIVIGTPVANRLQAELEPLIGFFVNTLVLRVNTNQDSLSDYFTHIRQVHLDAQSHQDVPFEQLVERLKVPRSIAHTPLFQIMIATNTDYGLNDKSATETFTLPDVDIQAYQSGLVQAKFDLNIELSISEQGVGLHWNYDTSLFTEQHIEQLNAHLCRLLEGLSQINSNTIQPLHSLPMLSDTEVHHLVHELNDTAMDYPKDKCIHELFEQQAQDNPDKIAVVFEDKQLTYRQLNEKANQLANYLVENHQIKPDTLVGLCIERSLEMVIGMLGILKAGGTYVPMDPGYPKARLDYMLEDAALDVVLTQSHLQEVVSFGDGQALYLDGLGDINPEVTTSFTTYATNNIDKAVSGLNSNHLAYVIYTSGSTGKPKGVLTPHLAVVRLTIKPNFMSLSSDTVFLQCANIAFDAATLEVWGGLLNGGQCVLYSEKYIDIKSLNEAILRHNVNSIFLTTSLFNEWSKSCVSASTLQWMLSGGEAVQPEYWFNVQCALPNLQLVHVYGPTENTTFSLFYPVPKIHEIPNSIPIGQVLSGDQVIVVSHEDRLLPIGAVGELCVGGDGLARGYLNRPELTIERFIDNPYYDSGKPNSSKRLYKTGDLVRYLPDGNIEFIGRIDDQVKIRGFRIELGEIEGQINQHEAVDSVLVLAKDTGTGDKRLVAYVKPAFTHEMLDNEIETAELALITAVKASLSVSLPDYMVPSAFAVIDQWPLTPNGKVDKKVLTESDSTLLQGEYIAPETDTEKALVEIWSALLNIEANKISTTANFFELGGHSLLMMRLVTRIKQLGYHTNVHTLFSKAVLQEMALNIASSQAEEGDFIVPDNLIPADCDYITPKMLPLVTLTQQALDDISETISGGAKNIQDIYPLAPLQEGLLFVHTMSEQRDPYVITLTFEFDDLDVFD